MRITNNDVTKMLFIKIFVEDFSEFQQYVQHVKNQYRKSMTLKSVYVFVQMDFAGDCQCSDEVQLVYWNFTFVTIHPTVSSRIILLSNKAGDYVVFIYDVDKKMPWQTSGN